MKSSKKNTTIIIYTLFFFTYFHLLTSCKKKFTGEIKNNDKIIIKVPDQIQVDLISWEEISSLKKVVALETTQESLITNIDKILTYNGNYYIMDWKAKSIFVFDKDGEFLSKLSKEGGAPGEYRELRDFDIDQDGNLHILDYRRILVYDQNFNFQKYIHLENEYNDDLFLPLRITIDPNQDYYLWKGSFATKDISKNKNNRALFKVSQEGKILDTYISFDLPINNDQRFFNGPDQTINITPIKGNDTIYGIENSHFQSRFFIDFEKNSLSNHRNSTEKSFGGVSNVIETADYLYFNFSDNSKIYVGLYSKSTEKLKVDALKFGKAYSLGLVIGSDGNTLISAIDSYIINMTLESIIANVKNKNTKDKLKSLHGLDKDSNPVLLLHKISGF